MGFPSSELKPVRTCMEASSGMSVGETGSVRFRRPRSMHWRTAMVVRSFVEEARARTSVTERGSEVPETVVREPRAFV